MGFQLKLPLFEVPKKDMKEGTPTRARGGNFLACLGLLGSRHKKSPGAGECLRGNAQLHLPAALRLRRPLAESLSTAAVFVLPLGLF